MGTLLSGETWFWIDDCAGWRRGCANRGDRRHRHPLGLQYTLTGAIFTWYLEPRVTNTNPEISVGELIKLIACALVDKPEEVSVKVISREAETLIELRVDPAEVGRVIGKQGRTARSLRIILSAVSIKLGHPSVPTSVRQVDPQQLL